jgi:hypothetical protein
LTTCVYCTSSATTWFMAKEGSNVRHEPSTARRTRDKSNTTEEPCAWKLASTVLETSRERRLYGLSSTILASCIVIPYISSYPCVTNLMLWGHILSVAPETSSIEGGDRFHLDTSHDRPDPFVARCDHAAPRGV